jgi:primary-amine oxidase
MATHPLDSLSVKETNIARDVIVSAYPDLLLDFREIFLREPPKDELKVFLAAEHEGRLSLTTPRPARLAKCHYDVIGSDGIPQYHESVVDVEKRKQASRVVVDKRHHASLTL